MSAVIYIYNKGMLICNYTSPLGVLVLGAVGNRLCMCDWADGAHHEKTLLRVARRFGAAERQCRCDVTDMASRQLDEYFEGRRKLFDLPFVLAGTDFQRLVWQCLQHIPYGTTVSYAAEARLLQHPTAVRAVAAANGANPLSVIIPCHRVVAADGSLSGYAGGKERKRMLIEMERGGLPWV